MLEIPDKKVQATVGNHRKLKLSPVSEESSHKTQSESIAAIRRQISW